MSGVLSLFSLEGQLALCTGATRGIGQATALGLAEAGADVILAQRDISNVETKTQIEALGRKAYIYECEFSSQPSVATLIPAILKDNHKPTILVNCAGIQRRHPAAEFPDTDWNDVIQVNLTSVFSLSRDFGAHLLSQPADPSGRRGAIIMVASIMTFQGGIMVPAYAAAKGGIGTLTMALNNEWAGKGINVNAIAPGYVATELTEALQKDPDRAPSITARIPAGRWAKPEDFKGVTVWLASRASSYVSGETVVVDGGWMGR
ncbi:NAD(P)-binding protein [Microthyrium microscopicum]|uniref:NAD(P)-binding protein n=1 Tax=Microthyrium microscopicum TaxID=703497 RepID=A0A6A6U540_9PEZI|nr:NAD(P)-binding protein [Microthyrium microscopicum]